MRSMRPWVGPLIVIAAATLLSTALRAQQSDPYPMTLNWGTGLINVPTAWVSPRSSDVWLTFSQKDLPSQPVISAMNWMTRWNQNASIDLHWGGRVSTGFSLYDQNPDWGFFGQVLLLRENEGSFLPSLSIGALNIGPNTHEDRLLIGTDVALGPDGRYHKFVPPEFSGFHTANTLYAVATKDFALSQRGGGTSLGLTVGAGNGLFSQDGGLGSRYAHGGTIVRGLFGGARFVTHPSLNTTLTLLAENDGWDYNAGVLYDWRGITFGAYETELEHLHDRRSADLNLYNYHKLNIAVGYSGNLVDISKGFILRGHITELAREQQLLRFQIAERNRRIRGLEVALAKAQNGELATIAERRAELQKQVDAEQQEIRKAEERLRELERVQQQPQQPPKPPKPNTPPSL